MQFLGLPKRKKSFSTLQIAFSSTVSLHGSGHLQGQEATLALPTKLDEVANSVHECVPQHLPGEQSSQDDVRYFLYQILTLKDCNLARKSPQWVLETCILWQGDGHRLRSMPLDAFQQLCPLRPGYAVIDWSVKGSKFRRQDITPCGVRDEIGRRIKNIVESLKRKEQGHRGPGWQNAGQPKPMTVLPVTMCEEQNSVFPGNKRFPLPSFRSAPSYPVQIHFYSVGNHSMPHLHQMSPVTTQQNSPYTQRQTPFIASPYIPQASGPMQRGVSPVFKVQPVPSSNSYGQYYPISTSGSPTSSYCQHGSFSSHNTNSTAQTSPFCSDNENQFWLPNISRPLSLVTPVAGSQCSSPRIVSYLPSADLKSKTDSI